MYTDNPLADFAAHDFQQQKELEQLPRCSECDEPITEYGYLINDEMICPECMDYHKVEI